MAGPKSICICGGGSLGHVIAAVLSNKGYTVNIWTSRPTQWQSEIIVNDCNGKTIKGVLNVVSGRPEDTVAISDMILLCVPGFLVEQTLRDAKPYIRPETLVGSVVCSNGFFWIARHILGSTCGLFGFQRVPYICRLIEYGKSAEIKGYKSKLKIAGCLADGKLDELAAFFSQAFDTPTYTLNHYLEATLTNSNPLLHPTRIYGMLSKETTDAFDKEFMFYEEWDDYSSEVLINCDNEFQKILEHLPVKREEIPGILEYYESTDPASLTRKIRSITAFKGIKMAMINQAGKYYVDYSNRYFTEDIPFGLLIIKSIAEAMSMDTPYIDTLLQWMQGRMQKEYLVGSELKGQDLPCSGIIQNFGIDNIRKLSDL
ncbi:opine dehydrogenase [Parabacteroides sp. PF5-5]|uniref:NAD/NADP octopine/nopaline dehydrogenase family protein n=1 Tax=unclassified Parabacteroides TaxID=2649774 RepID=UPI002476E4A2|nr:MULTISPECIES: NAD/NADP octopine/nopaline dehydrogenase family protein [unclassified Parabacteroides]MDH6306215.1 opine dehydrogenase [Parabacteroides sp. PH5-39]MDH6317174.1 opine dehydrogenase [Parabacteroides sp. PF5-13]MDH6320927.1 opine dehydrogenase [Parabacteroides sp. PH5-13]MDH6324658.1 opine dehydrogenase [Parabacteroides sp. PH5-8]MDH6328291.1 opine dehydrogenase [Parabacteroides sp. PH5-41]